MDWRIAVQSYIRVNALPPEKYGHQPRLYTLTRIIGEDLGYDDDVVYAAAWLHDLGVFVGHRPEGAAALAAWDMMAYAERMVPGVLLHCGFPAAKLEATMDCIRTHQPQCVPVTIEATILRDADILEQLGAIGILRTVAKVGRDTRFHTFTDAVHSLQRACDRLPQELRLPSSRELAVERVGVLRDWLNAVRSEAGEWLG